MLRTAQDCCCLLAAAQGWVLATIQDPYKPSNPWSKLYLMSWTGVLIVLLAVGTCNKLPRSVWCQPFSLCYSCVLHEQRSIKAWTGVLIVLLVASTRSGCSGLAESYPSSYVCLPQNKIVATRDLRNLRTHHILLRVRYPLLTVGQKVTACHPRGDVGQKVMACHPRGDDCQKVTACHLRGDDGQAPHHLQAAVFILCVQMLWLWICASTRVRASVAWGLHWGGLVPHETDFCEWHMHSTMSIVAPCEAHRQDNIFDASQRPTAFEQILVQAFHACQL